MTIVYHGTPITPDAGLETMAGEHFCVSFWNPQNAAWCERNGASVLWDNGAFSAHRLEACVRPSAVFQWLEPRLYHPHRAVVLDVINGDVETQRAAVRQWPFPHSMSWPVWHLDKPLSYLDELCDGDWSGVCLGSAGRYWKIGAEAWRRRMDEVFNHLAGHRHLPWLHGLRMLGQIEHYRLASADSTNVAQNWKRDACCPRAKSMQIKSRPYGRGASPHASTPDLFRG